uniref:Uncharacterized protein n=1 Tax=Arundo donax TaxID=35708 RepID=A0A0A8ZAB1_ARUDO
MLASGYVFTKNYPMMSRDLYSRCYEACYTAPQTIALHGYLLLAYAASFFPLFNKKPN